MNLREIMLIINKSIKSNHDDASTTAIVKVGNVINTHASNYYAWMEFRDASKILKIIDSTDEWIYLLHLVSGETPDSIVVYESNLSGCNIFACNISSRTIFYCIKNSEEIDFLKNLTISIFELINKRNKASEESIIDHYNYLIQEECDKADKMLNEISYELLAS